MSKRAVLRTGVVAMAVLAVMVVGAVWWVFVRDDAPPAAALVEREVEVAPSSALDGRWAVRTGPDVFAGYRIDEVAGAIHNTAVARTSDVTGSLRIAGTELTDVSVTVDMTTLVSQDDQLPVANRDRAMRTAGLESDTYPTASFTLTSPIDLGTLPDPGHTVRFDAVGELSLHGVERSVTVPFEARWNGRVVDVTASLDVELADYGIEQPAIQVVTVADHGTVELQLTFSPEGGPSAGPDPSAAP